MRVTRLHHVSVNANGTPLDDLVAFYRDVIGLDDEMRPEIPGVPGHWHRIGRQQLHLVDAPSGGPGIDPTGQHYCVEVEDLGAAIAELEGRGIAYVRGLQGSDRVQIWLTDPAGNTVELQQDPATR